MKVQLILLTLSLLLFSFIDSNSDKELEYSLYYSKIKKDAPKLDVSEIKFKKLPESKSLGYKNGTYWFKLVLENNSNQKNLTAYIPTHNIDKIDIYQFENDQLNYISSTGNSISQDQLPVAYKFPVFNINLLNKTFSQKRFFCLAKTK